jgi:hypothetical protein
MHIVIYFALVTPLLLAAIIYTGSVGAPPEVIFQSNDYALRKAAGGSPELPREFRKEEQRARVHVTGLR